MISRLLYALERSARYIKDHPQLLFVLILVFVLPALFLYTGQQFLNVGRDNQDRLQKDRVGLMQDAFVSILSATEYDPALAQQEIERITALNPDIVNFTITRLTDGSLETIAAFDAAAVASTTEYTDFYRAAAVRTDESLIFELPQGSSRLWYAYRAVEPTPGAFYFIFTEVSLESVDALFQTRERAVLLSLVYVYAFLLALAYWHIRMTDYRFLYSKAEATIATKDQFMNMMAHELRAPLTVIRGYADMILENQSANAVHEPAQRIADSTERLVTIVNDVLDVARLQSGKMKVESAMVDVSAVVSAVVKEQQVAAQAKQIALTAEGVAEEHPAFVDKIRLEQALTNLISNAIKYTPQGSITLAVKKRYKQVEIRVKDTGTGISFEDQQKLFAPFFRVASDSVKQITGSGLGMWITKQLIELMGGTVAVESIKDVGTNLVVLLPDRDPDEPR